MYSCYVEVIVKAKSCFMYRRFVLYKNGDFCLINFILIILSCSHLRRCTKKLYFIDKHNMNKYRQNIRSLSNLLRQGFFLPIIPYATLRANRSMACFTCQAFSAPLLCHRHRSNEQYISPLRCQCLFLFQFLAKYTRDNQFIAQLNVGKLLITYVK